jgi:hypothetical protein
MVTRPEYLKLKIPFMKNYESLIDALDDLKTRGYEADFSTEPDCLYCGDLDIRLNPEEFHVDEVYRFEEGSTPEDNAVLYAISATSGIKGTLVDAYGTYAENMSFEMAKKLQSNPANTLNESPTL